MLPTPQPTANRSIWEAAAGLETISEESSSPSCNLQTETSRLSKITLESSKTCIHTSRVHNAGIKQDFAYNRAERQLGWILELRLDAKWFWISRPVEPGPAELHQETNANSISRFETINYSTPNAKNATWISHQETQQKERVATIKSQVI